MAMVSKSMSAERASCLPIYGQITAVPYPQALVASAPPRWRFCRSFSLEYARMHARRGNHAATIAQAAKAVIEEGRFITRHSSVNWTSGGRSRYTRAARLRARPVRGKGFAHLP